MAAHLETEEINFRMKIKDFIKKYLFFPLFLLVTVSFISCSSSESAPSISEEAPAATETTVPAPAPIIIAEPPITASPSSIGTSDTVGTLSIPTKSPPREKAAVSKVSDSKPNKFDEYRVALAANKQIKIPGLPGELRVWIGNPHYQPNWPDDMTEANKTLPAVGEWAKIKPYAPAFTLEPPETPCIKIHPSGSEVRFNLIPKKSGTFKVGATVYLFSSSNCGEAPIPKIATDLYVTVNVDKKVIVQEKGKELWVIFWEQLLEFWAALLIILFGLILFLIRDRLKRWFGYEKN